MDPESLTVIAEVSAALAGFASLVGVLRREDRVGRRSAFGVVETSLIALAFALLPRMIADLRVSAFLFLCVWSAAWVNALLQYWKATGKVPDATYAPRLFRAVSLTFQLAGSVLALLILLGAWPEQAARLYEAAVICPLFVSCLLLWLMVRRLLLATEDSPAA